MKNLLIAALLLSTSAFAAENNTEAFAARGLELRAYLDTFNIAPEHQFLANTAMAVVIINQSQQKIRASFQAQMPCPPNTSCIQALQEIASKEVPLDVVTSDHCGSKIYRGRVDQRPVDGALTVLTVTDNTANHCPHMVALPATELVYETEVYNWVREMPVMGRSSFAGQDSLH